MVFACNVCFTYFQPIIAEFYKIQFDIEASTVGYLMTIVTAGYAIGSYGMGQVKQRKRLMVCIGCAFLGVSYLFVGPYKLLTHLDSILALTLVSQGLMGFSAALVYIPSVPLLNEFLAAYYPHRGV
jgi:MFS family permease